VERGEPLGADLADALATDLANHPEELAAIEAHEGPIPRWMAEELDRRDREDAGTEQDGEAVMARLLAKHSQRRRSA
jgi:hypothetical protein